MRRLGGGAWIPVAMAAALSCACTLSRSPGPAAAHAPEAPPATRDRTSAEAPAPSTAWDPPAWTPPAGSAPRTGPPTGMTASGGVDQPRWLLLRFVRAVRDGDAASLESLLLDPVLSPRLRTRPRDFWIERLTHHRRPGALEPAVPVEELVAVRRVEVLRAGELGARPPGMEEDDLILTFPLEPKGRRLLAPLLLWRDQGQIVVRPGHEPRIVGL
jgi:hypothetical protein